MGGSSGDELAGRWSPDAGGGSTVWRVVSGSGAAPSSEEAMQRKEDVIGRLLARGFGAGGPVVVATAVRNVAVPL